LGSSAIIISYFPSIRKFKVLAKNGLGENAQASIAISQGHLFIRTEKNLLCIGAK